MLKNIFKMKKSKLIAITVAVVGIAAILGSLTLRGSASTDTLAEGSQTYTVTRGDLSLEISAAGNLELAETEDLAFEVAGTVLEVMVETGDSVTEGQELAKLDTTEWEKQLKTLERAVVTAERSLTDKERAVTKAERQVASLERQVTEKENEVAKAERQVTEKELAVREAELSVQSAENSLYNIEDVKEAQDAIDAAEAYIETVSTILRGIAGGGLQVDDINYWTMQKTQAQEDLVAAQEDLEDILEDTSVTITADMALQVAQAQLKIEKSQLALEDAQIALNDVSGDVEDARIAVDDAEYAVDEAKAAVTTANYTVEDAKDSLEDAQEALDEVKSLSPIITAPFDGFIPQISVQGGDEVLKGTVAMLIADPNKFEAEIAVSEVDISQVELGGKAWVEVDALGVTLPATITYIAPTATIQSGVVNYAVTVEVESLDTTTASFPAFTDNTTMMPPAGSGNATMPFPGGTEDIADRTAPFGQSNGLADVQLKAGMTVTVSLVVSEAEDVLLVPYSAVTTEGRQKYVQVLTAEGETEKRAITTGITDYSYIEVTDGLSEGKEVLISAATSAATSASTDQEEQPGGRMMIPGISGGPPGGGPR